MKKYVIVGAGNRAYTMFAKPLVTELKEYCQLSGVYDTNIKRAKILGEDCGGVPVFEEFETMIKEVKPDYVIVTTIDSLHDVYIIKSMELGCDVITEKPMTINAEKCKAIFEAEKRTGRKVTVTFNVRFIPYICKIKKLLKDNAIGQVLSVDLDWFLDRDHGANYFRRWHSEMKNSGGLLVHKSTHHFDMINWWLSDEPQEIFAYGSLDFYGANRENRGQRCLTCDYKSTCEFYVDIQKDEWLNKLYYETEDVDGYQRDRCVFHDDIDIYDTMSLNVKYKQGATMTYSLNAYSPYEGWNVTLTGTHGRIEAGHNPMNHESSVIKLYDLQGDVTTYHVKKVPGIHGGGDERLRRMIFVGDVPDLLNQQASSWEGAMSLLIGAAANQSIKERKPVLIDDLLK